MHPFSICMGQLVLNYVGFEFFRSISLILNVTALLYVFPIWTTSVIHQSFKLCYRRVLINIFSLVYKKYNNNVVFL